MTPDPADDKKLGVTAIERDTQQALAESQAQLLRALEEYRAARIELQAADVAKDRFLAVLSHELRNPLASIDSAARLLQAPELPAADRDAAAQVVQRQAQAMKKLLDDLLDISRLKLGRLELQLGPVALASVVQSALETTRPLLEAAGHTLTVDLPSYPVVIDGDALRLGQVVSNLLTNAIKYTPPGGAITVKGVLQDAQAVLTVSDNGVGMEPGQIEKMFDMFAQAPPAGGRTQDGLGIGLALVRNLVELHGGKVDASSAGPGEGSQFRVILPATRGAVPVATPAPTPIVGTPLPDSRKRDLVLIADDNVDTGWAIARLLEIAGFATVHVRGGLEAVKEIRHQKPDVAILDIGMPDLNGHEAARQIRRTEWGKHMVLIAATGWGQESDEREAIESGFDAHMTKPVDLRKLSALVDELLMRKRA